MNYLTRSEIVGSPTPGEFMALCHRDPYWGAMRTAFERAWALYFTGNPLVHIVPVFPDSIPMENIQTGNRIFIPFPVDGNELKHAEAVSNDLDYFAAHMSMWVSFVPAQLVHRDAFYELGPNPTKQ